MSKPRQIVKPQAKPVDRVQHEKNCRICVHPNREEIERDFVAWKSPIEIAQEHKLKDRKSVYRHAHAFGLFSKRDRNIRAALSRIIECAGQVDVTAASVVAAVGAYAKINARGQWVERSEHVNLNDLFERMTRDELEAYARDGKLPDWFTQTVSAPQEETEEAGSDG